MHLHLLSLQQRRQDPFQDLAQGYLAMITRWRVVPQGIVHKGEGDQRSTSRLLEGAITPGTYRIMLDERGQDLTSPQWADFLAQQELQAQKGLTFIIGGPEGLSPDLREKAQLLVRFGRQTWPHKLVGLMLAEQLYRAQQILAHHPYHRA